MTKTKGGLMSFNNFLSTSKDRNISLEFARRALCNPDMMGILFVMTIDPSKSTTPFASIKDVGYFQKEDEVLFSMHTVFRIDDIKQMDENQSLFQVDLILTSDNDKDLGVLTERMREDIDPDCKEWFRLGKLLLRLSQFDKAQQIFEDLLDQSTDEIEKARIYHHIGLSEAETGRFSYSPPRLAPKKLHPASTRPGSSFYFPSPPRLAPKKLLPASPRPVFTNYFHYRKV
jgi:hypothetical protein